MSDIVLNLNMIVAFLCLLMAVHFFWLGPVDRRSGALANRLTVRMLAVCFFVMSLQALFLGLKLSIGYHSLPAVLQPVMPLLFASMSYLLFQGAADKAFYLSPMHALHIIPALTVLAEMLTNSFVINVDYIILATLMGYAIAFSRMLLRGSTQFDSVFAKSKADSVSEGKSIYLWLCVFTVYAWFSFFSDVLIYLELQRGQGLVQSIALLGAIGFKLILVSAALLFALRKSSSFDWLYMILPPLDDRELAPETEQDYADIIKVFEAILVDQRIYTEEALSLKAMANRIGVPARRFSNALNRAYNESYSKHINRKRVDFAAKLLRDNPDLAVIDVMYDAGFRTKSSFNREFKAIFGMSPSEYRKT